MLWPKATFCSPSKKAEDERAQKEITSREERVKTHLQHKTFTTEVPCEPVEEPRTAAGAVRFLKHTAAKAQPIS